MGIPCMNCQADVASADGKFFAECFVCPDCERVATRLFDQGQLELKHLLITLKELLRLAIIERRLQFVTPTDAQKPDTSFVEAIAALAKKAKNAEWAPSTTTPQSSSREPTKLLAATAGGVPSSSSLSDQISRSEIPSTPTPATNT